MPQGDVYRINPEALAYWYFRLNGFMTIANFVVHPEFRGPQRTDVDILGVRFPFRLELLENPMKDDEIFNDAPRKPYILISEVKSSLCRLNGPWTRPEDENMHRILSAIGCHDKRMTPSIAQNLYENGFYESGSYYITLFCVGSMVNQEIMNNYPQVPQKTWENILFFIYERFRGYRDEKAQHQQWDSTGVCLYNLAISSLDFDVFRNGIELDVTI